MRVELHFSPHLIDELALRDKTVVVIDVLRASTTIAAALSNGAKEIIPVATIEAAVKISGNLFGDVTLLGGERHGKAIPGFHLGNSPAEYSDERVRGKSIIFSTTNGAQALAKARYARELLVCGFVNISTVVDFLRAQPQDFIILCSGNNGMLSMEDSVCAGMLLHRLSEASTEKPVLSDGALAALSLYKAFGRSVGKMIRTTDHGRYLQEIGFGDDLALCARVDAIPVLPRLDGSVIRLKREQDRKDGPQPQ